MPSRKTSTQPQGPRRARLFRNGRNQALRIPRELEFPGDEVTRNTGEFARVRGLVIENWLADT